MINQAPTNKSNSLAKKSVGLMKQVSTNKTSPYVKKSAGFMDQTLAAKKY